MWVAFADVDGEELSPVVATRVYALILPLIEVDHDFGDSVHIGWPSEREARACVEAAGCVWPALILQ